MKPIKNFWTRHILISILCISLFPIQTWAEDKTKSDSIFINYLKEHNIDITAGNDIEILRSGHDKFIDLFSEIEKARHHIHLEYFNFRNDSIANKLFTLLEKKAKEGIEVRALYDAFGNSSNNQPLKKKH